MSIAWNAFTPAAALIGGVIIGAAVALFVVLNGRIAGVSGILGGLARPQAGDISWRVAFEIGRASCRERVEVEVEAEPMKKYGAHITWDAIHETPAAHCSPAIE